MLSTYKQYMDLLIETLLCCWWRHTPQSCCKGISHWNVFFCVKSTQKPAGLKVFWTVYILLYLSFFWEVYSCLNRGSKDRRRVIALQIVKPCKCVIGDIYIYKCTWLTWLGFQSQSVWTFLQIKTQYVHEVIAWHRRRFSVMYSFNILLFSNSWRKTDVCWQLLLQTGTTLTFLQ